MWKIIWSARRLPGDFSQRFAGIFEMLTLSVFLVEDESLIRMMIAGMIEDLGHRVVAEAASIAAAKPLAEGAKFDIAILDINVAGNEIWPVAQTIERRGLPFIFASGYTNLVLPAAFVGRRILEKPFPIRKLRDAIHAIWRA